MPRGDETKYTDKQIRKADHITESTRAGKCAIATAPSAKFHSNVASARDVASSDKCTANET
jgi:hypothetical protein